MTPRPLITVIIPTIGRPTLMQTLDSLAEQRLAQYLEVLVFPDVHRRDVPQPPELDNYQCFGRLIWQPVDGGYSAWGHPQRNVGLEMANGMWVCSLDDDDVWSSTAMDAIIGAVSQEAEGMHIFRMRYPDGQLLWASRTATFGNVGTPMMVWRNDPALVGRWGKRYEGDYDFLKESVHRLPNGLDSLHWHEAIIAEIKPTLVPA